VWDGAESWYYWWLDIAAVLGAGDAGAHQGEAVEGTGGGIFALLQSFCL
jgi:hypothetical protein